MRHKISFLLCKRETVKLAQQLSKSPVHYLCYWQNFCILQWKIQNPFCWTTWGRHLHLDLHTGLNICGHKASCVCVCVPGMKDTSDWQSWKTPSTRTLGWDLDHQWINGPSSSTCKQEVFLHCNSTRDSENPNLGHVQRVGWNSRLKMTSHNILQWCCVQSSDPVFNQGLRHTHCSGFRVRCKSKAMSVTYFLLWSSIFEQESFRRRSTSNLPFHPITISATYTCVRNAYLQTTLCTIHWSIMS